MKLSPGPALTQFKDHIETSGIIVQGHTLQVSSSDKQNFERLRQSFLAEVVSNLEAPFPHITLISGILWPTESSSGWAWTFYIWKQWTELDVLLSSMSWYQSWMQGGVALLEAASCFELFFTYSTTVPGTGLQKSPRAVSTLNQVPVWLSLSLQPFARGVF